VAAVLGSRRLALGLLRSLRVGDVLLLGRQGGPGESMTPAWLIAGRGRGALAWPCAAQGREITATGEHWMTTETMGARAAGEQDGSTVSAGRVGRLDPMADLEVDVHLQLQVLSTPLSELAGMRPGYVLELPVPAAEACVDLVVGGQVYGRAQLVRIGDRLGARILEMFDDA
jgi:type III secretion protein Q